MREKELYLRNSSHHVDNYFKSINETCTNVCYSCEGLWFNSSVRIFRGDQIKNIVKKQKSE